MTAERPFLRCPPFPGAGDAAARFNTPPKHDEPLEAGIATLAQLTADHRVGGTFWGAPAPNDMRGATIIRVGVDTDPVLAFKRLISRFDDGGACLVSALFLPDDVAGRRAARHLQKRGRVVYRGEFDPWSVLQNAARLLCDDPHDDWVSVAAFMGVPVNGQRVREGQIVRERILSFAWRNPYSGDPMVAAEVIRLLGTYRTAIDGNRAIAAAAGIAWWKSDEIRSFLWQGSTRRVAMPKRASRAIDIANRVQRSVAVWPSKVPEQFEQDAAAAGVPVYRMEDGFIRSVGLGSGLTPPLSVVVDCSGIYYDPSRPSDLETILAQADFSADLLERACALRKTIVVAGLSKYGRLDKAASPFLENHAPAANGSTRKVLVTGQVEDDRSVLLGGGEVGGNLDLLRRVRASERDSTILFRPHPDVEAGHRRGAVPDSEALNYADRVVRGGSIIQAIEAADAVHIWTSLAGFEALLRGKEVVTHGQPFFAGWGLTCDLGPVSDRRGRTLTLDKLVAATLILYPRYLDPVTRLPCTPEILIDRLRTGRYPPHTLTSRLRALQGRGNGLLQKLRAAAG